MISSIWNLDIIGADGANGSKYLIAHQNYFHSLTRAVACVNVLEQIRVYEDQDLGALSLRMLQDYAEMLAQVQESYSNVADTASRSCCSGIA